MRLVTASLGSLGDILPFLNVGRYFKRKGWNVTALANEKHQQLFETHDIEFGSILAEAQIHLLGQDPAYADPKTQPQTIARYLFFPPVLPVYERIKALADQEPVVILAQRRMFGARLAQEALGLPLITASLTPYESQSFLTVDPSQAGDILREPLNEIRKGLGLAANDDPIGWMDSPQGLACFFPNWFDEPENRWPEHRRCLGFPLDPEPDPISGEIMDFVSEGEAPLVFLAGTFNHLPDRFFGIAREICERLGKRGLFLGHPHLEHGKPVRINQKILASRFIPLGAILSRAAALVHHGGVGTCAEAMRAGAPQLVVPNAFDQFIHGRIVQKLGIGEVTTVDAYTPATGSDTLKRLLGAAGAQSQGRRVADMVASQNGVVGVSALLETLAESRQARGLATAGP